jgi:hypothetical protein
VICFSNKVVTACGPGDSVHRDRRGRDAKDLGLGQPDLEPPFALLLRWEGLLGNRLYLGLRAS